MPMGSFPPPLNTERRVEVRSTDPVVNWLCDWTPAAGLDSAQAVLKRSNVTGGLKTQVIIQTAEVRPDVPDTPVVVGSEVTGAGETQSAVLSLVSNTGPKFWFRVGVGCRLVTGTFASGDVRLVWAWAQSALVLPPVTAQLVATSTDARVLVLSGWLPRMQVIKVKGALVLAGLTGTLKWRLVYRTAATSTEVPGAWQTASFDTERTDAAEDCTGNLTPGGTGDMYIQFGLQYYVPAGSSYGQATFSAALAVTGG